MAHQSRRHRRFAKAEDDSQNNDSNDDVSVHSSQEDDTESNGRNIDANISKTFSIIRFYSQWLKNRNI